jgi:hypothetical protein
MTETMHLGLPYLAAAQAQKHVTHNEALSRLDAVVQLAVIDTTLTAPPGSPAEGDRYIVADGATGAWAGHDGEIAAFIDGAWVLVEAKPGWLAFDAASAAVLVRHDDAWVAIGSFLGAVARFGVNAEADDTNRLAVRSNAVLVTGVEAGDGGTGDVRVVIDKEADGDTASLLFQSGSSGRAEVGLAGDTDFVFKVSADGAAWTEAIRIDKDTGLASLASDPASAMHAATKQYVDQIVAAQDAMVFKGVVDCAANPDYPAGDRGDTYRVSVAGKIGGGSGVNVEAGDLLLCLTDSTASGDQATVGANWSIQQTNLDGAVIGPASVTDGVPALFDGVTGKLIKATTFSAFKTALALVKADVGLGNVLDVPQREALTAGRTYYVRTDGSDSNTGLSDNSGGAFLTIQKAVSVVSALDLSIYNVTIQVRDGTYVETVVLGKLVGSGTVTIRGNTSTPANVVVEPASSYCFHVLDGASGWAIDSLRCYKATNTAVSAFRVYGSVSISNLDFGTGFTAAHILAEANGYVQMSGAVVVSGSCARFAWITLNGIINKVSSGTITMSGTPAFSTAFVVASTGAVVGFLGAATITGSATGKRFDVTLNGVLTYSSGAANLPGDVAGTTATGGQAV